MAIATLFNIPVSNALWLEFSFANQDSHNKIQQAIFAKHGILIPSYPLDPISWHDLQNWGRNHQQWHNAMNAITGVAGADLTIGDLRREDVLANFIRLHATEHVLNETALGVT